MTVLPTETGADPALFGQEGELVSLKIAVEPKLLEDLLEALAALDFPVNPELFHRAAQVVVEFPAYSARVEEVRGVLQSHGFNPNSLGIARVLARTAEN